MAENHDVGSPGFEDRIRDLFADGAAERAVSAQRVIDGARRRRVRHRATAAGSSLAVLGMLGVAAGAIVFGGHAGGSSQSAFIAKHAGSPALAPAAVPASKTCSAAVTGAVTGTTSTTIDGLAFETVSGKAAGLAWQVQIHVFPDKQAHLAWEDKRPSGTVPQAARDAEASGAVAQFRTPGVQGYTEYWAPAGSAADQHAFTISEGSGIGSGTPAGSSQPDKDYPAYVTVGWMAPDVDHLCAQYADHAEFVPLHRIQGGSFYVFGYNGQDRPQKVICYNSAGTTVATANANKSGPYFLSSVG